MGSGAAGKAHGDPACAALPVVAVHLESADHVKVGVDSRVPVGGHAVPLEVSPGSRVVLCQHPSGHHTVLAHPPTHQTKPLMLFTNCPTYK